MACCKKPSPLSAAMSKAAKAQATAKAVKAAAAHVKHGTHPQPKKGGAKKGQAKKATPCQKCGKT